MNDIVIKKKLIVKFILKILIKRWNLYFILKKEGKRKKMKNIKFLFVSIIWLVSLFKINELALIKSRKINLQLIDLSKKPTKVSEFGAGLNKKIVYKSTKQKIDYHKKYNGGRLSWYKNG